MGYQRTSFYTDQIKCHRPLEIKSTDVRSAQKLLSSLHKNWSLTPEPEMLCQSICSKRAGRDNLVTRMCTSHFHTFPFRGNHRIQGGSCDTLQPRQQHKGRHRHTATSGQNTLVHTELKATSKESGSDTQPCCSHHR